jgi:acyl carrier protein
MPKFSREQMLSSLADILSTTPEHLQLDLKLTDIEKWDSLAVLSVITIADNDFGIACTGTEIMNCTTIGELLDIIEKSSSQ